MCLAAFALVPVVGFSLFPAADTSFFLVRIERPQGSSIPSTNRAVRDISALLRREPYVVNRMENAGHGNPQVFYNVLPREENARYGEILATTRPWDAGEAAALFARLRRAFERYPDARLTLETFQNGPPISAPIEVRISGPNLDLLKMLSDRVVRKLEQIPGMRDVESPIALDRARSRSIAQRWTSA
jgi:multidrug efflux pump subunit AcrB